MGHSHPYRRPRLYRSRHGMILGICRGLADYLRIPTFGIRAAALVLLIATGFWPIGALYLLAALILKPEPVWT